MSADWVRLAPDTPAAHAALKQARELTRAGDYALTLDVLAGPAVRETPLGRLLGADLLLALGRAEAALAAAEAVALEHGDTGQGLLCLGQARLALGDRPGAAEAFARAAMADPGRIAARVNAAALAGPPKPLVPAAKPAVAVTSLPPTAGQRCRLALHSWRAAGFSSIVSVNAAEEIAALAGRFPEVTFVAARETAKADYGRACPAVGELLTAGADIGAPAVAVLNADVVLAAGPDFAARLAAAARGGLVAGCRVDVPPDVPGQPQPASCYYDVGFDLCAVDTAYAQRPELEGFWLGLPWWDYALPLAVARAGGTPRFCAAPVLIHAAHGAAWSHRAFLGLGRRFAGRFWPDMERELLGGCGLVADAGPEAWLAALGGRVAELTRRAPDAGLWDRIGFCPHDPTHAARAPSLTPVNPDAKPPR